MASVAIIGAVDVGSIFVHSNNIVMTIRTFAAYMLMVYGNDIRPSNGVMAGDTLGINAHMVERYKGFFTR